MKRISEILFLSVLSVLVGCSQEKQPVRGESEFQVRMNSTFKDASKSPLLPKDLKVFEGLDFFPIDSNYVVKGILERTPESPWFKMKTNTDRVSEERIYGVVKFKLLGKDHQLNVYQGKENLENPEMHDYLFLPFLDDTNGETTYGGGRYIDLTIPAGDTLWIDFNTAYNPYCAYNEKFSCPIVPRENYVPIKIKAGVKAFKPESKED